MHLATTPTHFLLRPFLPELELLSSMKRSALHPVSMTAPRAMASTSHVVSVPRFSPVGQPM
jgi:hypothetical protein